MERKTIDNFIYLGAAGVIVAALAFYVFYTDKKMGRIPPIPAPLLWGVFSTLGILGLVLERFWRHRHRSALWCILVGAALINILVMFAAYWRQWDPPIFIWSIVTVLWILVVFFVGDKLLSERPK